MGAFKIILRSAGEGGEAVILFRRRLLSASKETRNGLVQFLTGAIKREAYARV